MTGTAARAASLDPDGKGGLAVKSKRRGVALAAPGRLENTFLRLTGSAGLEGTASAEEWLRNAQAS